MEAFGVVCSELLPCFRQTPQFVLVELRQTLKRPVLYELRPLHLIAVAQDTNLVLPAFSTFSFPSMLRLLRLLLLAALAPSAAPRAALRAGFVF